MMFEPDEEFPVEVIFEEDEELETDLWLLEPGQQN